MKDRVASALGVLFALLALALAQPRLPAQTPLAAPGSSGGSDLRLEGGPFLDYRINRARLLSDSGIEGLVRVEGRLWDGRSVDLFAARAAASTGAMDIAFYLDEGMRGFEVLVDGPVGTERLEVDLATETASEPATAGSAPTAGGGRTEVVALLRGLEPPTRVALGPPLPPAIDIENSSLSGAGSRALSAFARPAPRRAWPILLLLAAVGIVAAGVPRPEGRRRRLALILPCAAAASATVGLAFAAAPVSTLFVAVFPAYRASAPLSGVLDRRVEPRAGYSLVSYAPGQAEGKSQAALPVPARPGGSIELLGIAAPVERGIPLDDLDQLGSDLRFASPPSITSRGGRLLVGADELLTGWVVHDSE